MNNHELLDKFYSSFKNKDASSMISCYHKEIIFKDPAFGTLKGERAEAMWKMLLSRKESELEIEYNILDVSENQGRVNWVAHYTYGAKKRKVVNKVSAYFEFKNGKIYRHTDTFNLYSWAKQALGIRGTLFGWTPFFRKKIQQKTNNLLSKFISQSDSFKTT